MARVRAEVTPGSYAVNLGDLMFKGREIVSECLISPVCPSRTTVEVEPRRADGVGVLLECEEERARAIVEVLRIKFKSYELRCYRRERGRWRRV